MLTATFWGAVAAFSLVLGAGLALVRPWSDRIVGIVLAFGAGALISAVSYELAEEGIEAAGQLPVAAGLAAGALCYFAADRPLERKPDSGGLPLALGAFLDGLPEQAVLGIGLASAEPEPEHPAAAGALLVMLCDSMIPESRAKAGLPAGLVLVLGFAVAAGLSIA